MNEEQIMKLMNTIDYGWIDKNKTKHIDDFEFFSNEYILQSPEELVNSKLGTCWDQVELEREFFKNNKTIKTFFIVNYDNKKTPTHTFLTYKKGNNYYWFEHSWEKFRGIHQYNSLELLLKDVYNKFVENELESNSNKNIIIYEYSKPKYHISVQEFYKHCEQGTIINL